MVKSKMLVTKQLKEECMYHKQLIEWLKKDPNYHQLATNKLNQILYQTCKLSPKYLLRRTNEKTDGANAPKYKVVPATYADRSKTKRDKAQSKLPIKIVDYMIYKFDLGKESLEMFTNMNLSISYNNVVFVLWSF